MLIHHSLWNPINLILGFLGSDGETLLGNKISRSYDLIFMSLVIKDRDLGILQTLVNNLKISKFSTFKS